MIDVDRLRADTPGTEHVIHLDSAGSSLMPQPVIDAIHGYLDEEARIGGYTAKRRLNGLIEGTYASLARLIGASTLEIAMAENASRAWQLAFYSLGLGDGDRVLTTETEYVSNWAAFVQVRKEKGVRIEVVPSTEAGDIDLEAMEAMIDGDVALIAINHVPTNCGIVLDAEGVGRIANAHGIPYLLDACQSVGQVPIDVRAIGCDVLTASARKYLRGPRGVGFLYVKESFIDRVRPLIVETGSARSVGIDDYELAPGARRFETWEKNYAGIVGTGAAADYAIGLGMDAIWERIADLASELRARLDAVPGVSVLDVGSTKGGIVTFNLEGVDAADVERAADRSSINVSISTMNSAPYDMRQRGIDRLVRASVHAFNTEDELAALTEILEAVPR